MTLIIILGVLAIFFLLWSEFRYFHNQKKECRKYPFYKLRDEIIWEIIDSEKPEQYLKIYDDVNEIIGKIKHLNFNFYTELLQRFFNKFIEEAIKHNFQVGEEFLKEIGFSESSEFEKRFAKIILKTAKANSFPLRLAMTRIGYKILVTKSIFKGLFKFIVEHPEFLKKQRQHIQTAREYSYLNYVLASK